MANFYDDLERGKLGEQAVIRHLAANNYKVTDVTADKEYQKKDIDILVDSELLGKTVGIEIKSLFSFDKYGDIVLEVKKKHGGDGWYRTSEADFFIFYDVNGNQAFQTSSAKLRQYVDEQLDAGTLKIKRANGDYCYFIHVDDTEGLFKNYEVAA